MPDEEATTEFMMNAYRFFRVCNKCTGMSLMELLVSLVLMASIAALSTMVVRSIDTAKRHQSNKLAQSAMGEIQNAYQEFLFNGGSLKENVHITDVMGHLNSLKQITDSSLNLNVPGGFAGMCNGVAFTCYQLEGGAVVAVKARSGALTAANGYYAGLGGLNTSSMNPGSVGSTATAGITGTTGNTGSPVTGTPGGSGSTLGGLSTGTGLGSWFGMGGTGNWTAGHTQGQTSQTASMQNGTISGAQTNGSTTQTASVGGGGISASQTTPTTSQSATVTSNSLCASQTSGGTTQSVGITSGGLSVSTGNTMFDGILGALGMGGSGGCSGGGSGSGSTGTPAVPSTGSTSGTPAIPSIAPSALNGLTPEAVVFQEITIVPNNQNGSGNSQTEAVRIYLDSMGRVGVMPTTQPSWFTLDQ
jgi:type II secretory pathway pseudopilin PulG